MPVVTVDEPFIMPVVFPGYETPFNITLRNHGLINAEQIHVVMPDDPDFIITALIDEIPILPAKSEVTIPCTIRFRNPGEPLSASCGDLEPSGHASAIMKCLGIDTLYTDKCEKGQWVSVPVQVQAAVGCAENVKDAFGSVGEFLATHTNLIGAGCDVAAAALDQVEFKIADLPGALLGQTVGNTIVIDADAGGYGWFIDPTPANNQCLAAARSPGSCLLRPQARLLVGWTC